MAPIPMSPNVGPARLQRALRGIAVPCQSGARRSMAVLAQRLLRELPPLITRHSWQAANGMGVGYRNGVHRVVDRAAKKANGRPLSGKRRTICDTVKAYLCRLLEARSDRLVSESSYLSNHALMPAFCKGSRREKDATCPHQV